ncbi:Ras-related protein Rab-35 [Paragonimus westermani]|uniref:Ras-related protein Rab-35 n=1 Tax=Paragonimus westermani TaxID=34504 RepID=A0A5J4NKL2_9TREM|nr:Ras-related protein Rab-35 [Paragonimus westermani]
MPLVPSPVYRTTERDSDVFLQAQCVIWPIICVGKSSLLLRYTDNDFSGTYISTIGVDFKVKTVTVDGLRVKLQIWDTAGQDRFRTITSTYYRGAHGIIIVYDVNDVRTFCNVERWTEEANMYVDETIARILVGNKNECPELKTVATQDAQRLAAKYSCLFIETSAKSDENVDQVCFVVFYSLLNVHQISGSGFIAYADMVILDLLWGWFRLGDLCIPIHSIMLNSTTDFDLDDVLFLSVICFALELVVSLSDSIESIGGWKNRKTIRLDCAA